MLTCRTERSSYEAQGTGATTFSKMSLLIETMATRNAELASKATKGKDKYGQVYVIGDYGALQFAICQRINETSPIAHIITAASTTGCSIHVCASCSNSE